MLALPALVALFVVIIVAYYGVIRGWLFKGLLLVGGSFSMYIVLLGYPSMAAEAFRIGVMIVSYAAAIPLGLVVLVLMTSRSGQ